MPDMFDYLKWRGDILFSQLPPNPVDALVLSTLSYVQFRGAVPETIGPAVTLAEAAQAVLASPEERFRTKMDRELLKAAADAPRFAQTEVTFYQDVFIPEEDTQFAALTWLLGDGTAFLAFRGTDNTLVGWKEDFNMTFQESVPAQRLAQEYTQKFAAAGTMPLRLCGHSKGGNLAVYAAAKSGAEVQDRILEVYNQDGPGFTERMMDDPGYRNTVPKIRTYVPQSSVFGMLLEHEEPYTVVRSRQIGLMQHDPYSWEVMGGDFILVEQLTANSRFLDRTFKSWLAGMPPEERNRFFDTVFELLMTQNANRPRDIMRPQNIRAYFKTLQADENMRRVIAGELLNLVESARRAYNPKEESDG